MTNETEKTTAKVPMNFKISQYMAKNPHATPQQVADAVGATRAYVHTVAFKLKAKAKKAKKHAEIGRLKMEKIEGDSKMVRVYLATSNNPIGNSITMAADEVTNLTVEQKERLIAQLGKPRARMQDGGVTLQMMKDTIEDLQAKREAKADNVNHPAHYKVGGIETIDFIEAKKLNYNLGNVVKYITRSEYKGNRSEDLAKARWYLNREIAKVFGGTQ